MRYFMTVGVLGLALAACEERPAPAPTNTYAAPNAGQAAAPEATAPAAASAPAASATNAAIAAQSVRFGIDGPDLDSCGGYGEVTGLDPKGDNFLSVRSAPDAKASEVDRLSTGQGVFFCDSAKGSAWVGIVYDKSGSKDCGTGTPVAATKPYDGPCQSGWVSAKFVTLIAG